VRFQEPHVRLHLRVDVGEAGFVDQLDDEHGWQAYYHQA
jgi:hypothetical protein